MDSGVVSIVVAGIATAGTIAVAAINALKDIKLANHRTQQQRPAKEVDTDEA